MSEDLPSRSVCACMRAIEDNIPVPTSRGSAVQRHGDAGQGCRGTGVQRFGDAN